jgi:8-oxo-dGTP pyrophosphatase MutT (NUDIX family)
MSWKNPIPVAVCLVGLINEQGKDCGVLTIRRGIEPCLGELALPGGYCDEGETVEIAAAREFDEEVGIPTIPELWRPIKTFITPQNRLLVFMALKYRMNYDEVKRLFVPNHETQGVACSVPGDTLCFDSHTEMLANRAQWLPGPRP